MLTLFAPGGKQEKKKNSPWAIEAALEQGHKVQGAFCYLWQKPEQPLAAQKSDAKVLWDGDAKKLLMQKSA